MPGKIYLIPVTLGGDDFRDVIPGKVINLIPKLRHFIAEDLRSARRYLRMIDSSFPIDESVFFLLNEHTVEADISGYLDPVLSGHDMGLMSEAGLPCLADPGSRIVEMAHKKNITVVPLSGPSSIILALIASGFNGQNFTFNGYLPVKPAERVARIRELEKKTASGYTQIFMEAPYRNQKLLESLLETCNNETRLCIAVNLTLPDELVQTKKIKEWKNDIPSLNDKPAVFLIQ